MTDRPYFNAHGYTCPHCRAHLQVFCNPQGRPPREGETTICTSCFNAAMFEGYFDVNPFVRHIDFSRDFKLRLRPLTRAELNQRVPGRKHTVVGDLVQERLGQGLQRFSWRNALGRRLGTTVPVTA